MAKSTRDSLVRSGLDLFCEHGFNAVGLDQVLRRVGVTKTTFYNYFDSKEQLIRETIEVHVQERRERLLEGIDRLGGDDPKKRLLAAFDVLHEIFSDGSYCGCLLLNALIEFPSPHDQVHVVASEHTRKYGEIIENLATEAGVADAKAFAIIFGMLYDGAIIAHRAMSVDNAAMQARAAAEILLNAER